VKPVAILASGMVTGVGFDAASSCAAMRVGITGFVETRFRFAGEWLIGCPVPFAQGWRGRERVLRMLVPALAECLRGAGNVPAREVVLLLCVAEQARPGRLDGLDETLVRDVEERLETRFHPESGLIAGGRLGGADALDQARRTIASGRRQCIVAGVDGFLLGPTLTDFEKRRRLLTADNSDGFIPGEAAAAVAVGPPSDSPAGSPELHCIGVGFGTERATVESAEPLRGDGLAQAFRGALSDAGLDWSKLDYQIAAISGEQYSFKETALAAARVIRPVKHGFDLWHPSDCIGEVGAAIVPCMLGVALAAARKHYAPGPGVLCHAGGDDGRRAAIVLRYDAVAA
jgi:3-oxoacyl-[acyl-carrier-protein] synthase I